MKLIIPQNRLIQGTILVIFVLAGFEVRESHKLFDKEGRTTTYDQLLIAAENSEIILFGELHNNPICHWLQLELTKDLNEAKPGKLILGAEMFESDNQMLLDEFLAGLISEANFEKEAKLWPNYHTDYKPLVKLAKEKNIPFVASNIPRRYANMVYKKGFGALEELSAQAKDLIAPLPVAYDSTLKGYRDMLAMGGKHGSKNLPKAQAIKDATMAYFIHKNLKSESTLIHYNGTYHSSNFEGINWYLRQLDPDLKILTIASVEQAKIDSLQNKNKGVADFILAIPSTMTKTY